MPDTSFITSCQTTDGAPTIEFRKKPDALGDTPQECLGMLMVPLSRDSVLKVGDEIVVLRKEGDPEIPQQSQVTENYKTTQTLPPPRRYF